MKILSSALVATFLSVAPASAAVLTFFDNLSDATTERFTLSCSLGCSAWAGGTTFNAADGSGLMTSTFGNETAEAGVINGAAGTSFLGTDGTKSADLGLETYNFSSNAEYFFIKVGKDPRGAVVWNTGGLGNLFGFQQSPGGTGTGLSHYTEFGIAAAVPLPASGWLLLTVLGAGAFVGRRKKAA